MVVFHTRTFSNTIESILLAVAASLTIRAITPYQQVIDHLSIFIFFLSMCQDCG